MSVSQINLESVSVQEMQCEARPLGGPISKDLKGN